MPFSILAKLGSSKLFMDNAYFNDLFIKEIIDGSSDHCTVQPLSGDSFQDIQITNTLENINDLNEAIFYHPIVGPILASDYGYDWLFSTKRFVHQLKEADANPKIIAHFLHICSGGGQAWMLDKAAEAMRNCKKPIYAFIEQTCASAAYYLAVNANVIKAYTQNDEIGSIGTMVSFWDSDSYLEALKYKKVEAYSTKSDLKNKTYNDLIAGKPGKFITEQLDPLQKQFESEIRSARKALADLPEDHPVVRGETFNAVDAQELGLIDGITELETAIRETYDLGITIKNNNNLLKTF